MFRVTNYGTYALIGIYILYLFILAILKLNRLSKDLKKPTLSFSLREREILDTLGYVYEDETDEQSDEEKKDETKNLLEQNCAELEQSLQHRTKDLEKSFEEIGLLKHRIMDLEQHLAEAQDYQVTIKRLDTERVVLHNENETPN